MCFFMSGMACEFLAHSVDVLGDGNVRSTTEWTMMTMGCQQQEFDEGRTLTTIQCDKDSSFRLRNIQTKVLRRSGKRTPGQASFFENPNYFTNLLC